MTLGTSSSCKDRNSCIFFFVGLLCILSSTLAQARNIYECSTAADCSIPNTLTVRCQNSTCIVVSCRPGFNRVRKACISASLTCSRGQEPSSDGLACITCPQNKYKDQVGNAMCTPCPAGTQTAGQKPQNHDSESKCLPGGLSTSYGNVLQPRLRLFNAQLAAAKRFMSSSVLQSAATVDDLKPSPSLTFGTLSTPGVPANLSTAIAYIAGSPQVVTPYQELQRQPSRKPRVLNQGRCATCVNAAMTSATEATIASIAGTSAENIRISPVYAYYCQAELARSCSSGWTFSDAFEGLEAATSSCLPDMACTEGWDLESIRNVNPGQLRTACNAVAQKCPASRHVSGCRYQALKHFWEIQRAIRTSAAVITRIDVTPDFVEFFSKNATGVYATQVSSADAIPHAVVLVGYNNEEGYWWAQNSYGTEFADQGVFKIAYGVALAANPNETFVISCDVVPGYPISPVKRWPLQPLGTRARTNTTTTCYTYTGQRGDYLAGIAEHFGVEIVPLIRRNANVLNTTAPGGLDLTSSLEGKRLRICNISKDLSQVAAIACGPGEQQTGIGVCEVCPIDHYKEEYGPGPCMSCASYNGGHTKGCDPVDRDHRTDCKAGYEQLMCEQFIGIYNKSGVYNVTLHCKQYQVYCEMETDGGGWTLIMNYNIAAGTFPTKLFARTLDDGFPLLHGDPLGTDESSSTRVGGSWGHMAPPSLATVPNFGEVMGVFEMGKPDVELPDGVELPDVLTSRYKSNDSDTYTYLVTETKGANMNVIRNEHTPLAGHNNFMPSDGMGGFDPMSLYGFAPILGVPVRHQIFLRGRNPNLPICPPGTYPQGWSCHICPDHTYKDTHGPGPCGPCPPGTVATAGVMGVRKADNHDTVNDCQPATPDASWNITRADGSRWTWEFFWNVRARQTQAQAVCQQRGGNLITVDSGTTADLISVKLLDDAETGRPTFPFLYSLAMIWMGLYNPTESPTLSKTSWRWYSGAPYDVAKNYTKWLPYNPDNFKLSQGFAAAFLLDNNQAWDDYYTKMYLEFLCERRL